jgi:mono/diheme cytochrome c family protein
MKTKLTTGTILALAMCAATPILAADGKALYEQHCAKCHGADGKGNTKMGQKLGIKDYSNAKTWEGLTDAAALKAVKEGVKAKDDKIVMKPTEGLADAEAKGLVEHMKSLKK